MNNRRLRQRRVMNPSKSVLEQMAPYRWVVASNPKGLSGPQLGAASGQSTEFMDHRVYVAGDDVRRIDWNATARTDQLLVKRYQEEVRPSVVLLVDDSKSMSVFDDKRGLLYDGVAWIHQSLDSLEAMSKTICLQSGPLALEQSLRGEWSAVSSLTLPEGMMPRTHDIPYGAHVIILSDLLSPHEPSRLATLLKQRAHRCTIIQILAREDWEFVTGTFQVQDSETGELMQLTLDSDDIAQYHSRIERIQADWRSALAGWGELVVLQSPSTWPEAGEQLLKLGLVNVP